VTQALDWHRRGLVHSVDEVLGLYGKLFELTGGNMAVDLKSVTVDGDTIARIDEVPSDQAAEDAFWG
jgi:hypothetical protein